MARSFTLVANRQTQVFRTVAFKDEVEKYSIELTPWEEDNGDVTTATWTVKSGNVSIGSKTLTSNVAAAVLTFSDSGSSLIQLKLTDGTHTVVVHFYILAKDPFRAANDYGLCA